MNKADIISEMNSTKEDMFDIQNDQYIETPWTIIESYFKGQHLDRLVRHQLESYNNFVNYQIIKTIEMFNPVHIASDHDYDQKSGKHALEIFVTFENFHMFRPQIHENNGATSLMFPQVARLRNFTYASAMTVDINIKFIIRTGENLENIQTLYKTLPKIHIGKIPIMLKSNICVLTQYKHVENSNTGECKFDAGGYFIINGSEKTVLGQERAAENRVYCFNISKNSTKYTWSAEIKSVPDFKCISPKQINLYLSSKNNGFGFPIYVQLPRVKQPIPLLVVFRALGIISDHDICKRITLNVTDDKEKQILQGLQASIIDANNYLTEIECIRYITTYVMYTPINMDKETGAKKKSEFTMDILSNDLFPHCNDPVQKIMFLGYMTHRLLEASFDWIKQDDRDSYINKRIDLTGTLLNNLFRNYFNKLVKDMEKQVIKEINTGSWKSTDDYLRIINETNIYKIIKSTTIENGIKRALSTGDFGIKHVSSNKVGVAQVLNRLTYIASLSHARRISTPTDKSGKLIPPRKLHSTTFGFVCPSETPEGQSVGVVKNLSYMSHVTIHSNSTAIYEYIMPHITDIRTLTPEQMYEKTKVFINGAWIGITDEPSDLYTSLKDKKYRGIINVYTSIVFDYRRNEIRVCNDSGRITRPLLRVKDNNILLKKSVIKSLDEGKLKWDDLLTNCKLDESIIEYIDPEEQSWSLISVKPSDIIKKDETSIHRYTHCEIHPSTMFGILASCIPFPEHNQSPRNTYQSAQAKQAMGVYVTNYHERMDKTAYVLNYPARPMVDTRVMDMIQINKIPSGFNVIVAIMTHTGYNQEDSLLFNKASIDRGLFQATIYHTEKDEDKQKINGDEEIRCKPDSTKTKGMKFANYNKVNNKGLIPENMLVENRDVIISKVTPIRENRNDHTKVIKYEDQSRIYRTDEPTYIDKNYIDRNGDGYNFAKVRLRAVRKPVIGDKFSSRSGQKGTIGNIIPEEDIPFTKSGIKPDLILNPHAIPSRMTIAQLKETLMGKVLIELGLFGDGTSFGELDINFVRDELLKLGYQSTGNEVMYSGLTGEQIECDIFIGPVFYQRLKHMVIDKQHSRSIGPMVNLTRQPAEGRSRDGGLRFGEMERDCFEFNHHISIYCGLAVKIGTMGKCGYKVLGYSEKENGIVPAIQSAFMNKGERECIQITFEDGKKIICTPEHPILNSNNEWTKAKDLVVGETRIKNSVNYPLMEIEKEIQECNGWSLNMEGLTLTTNNEENYLKTLAFSRILGYLICDGHIPKDKDVTTIFLGHNVDVHSIIPDLELFCEVEQPKFKCNNYYYINLYQKFTKLICSLKGILRGRKVNQSAELPEFILQEDCPRPIIREFLGGLFGADGHTCVLGMHRGKRDIMTSIGFSQSKTVDHIESLDIFMENLKMLLNKCGIEKVTVQNLKQTTNSKKNPDRTKVLQSTLHLDIEELVPFSEKIGFRYCCHKSQRLEAGVSYKRLRNEVVRQHNWLVTRVDEITKFSEIKKENPNKIVPTKKAIIQAVEELKRIETLVHEYAIPSTHDITDHLIKGTSFGKFTSKSFPTAEEYLEQIDALTWFIEEPVNTDDSDNEDDIVKKTYGVNRDLNSLPTMNLKVIDIRPAGLHEVFDIQVDDVHSFLAEGAVSHNCMIAHGASRFTRGRLYDASDKYQVYICKKCGLIAAYNDKVHIHRCKTCDNRTDFSYVEIPYACKLLFQELITMNIAPRVITEN
jgi:DNA-directed RNA polymerase II subunit RPB2